MRTTVIGSYSVPDWYAALQAAVTGGRLVPSDFHDAKCVAARAAIKDQEKAGLDIITDGELFRRDDNCFGPPNAMINYFAAKISGFSPEPRFKTGISPVAPEAGLPVPVIIDTLKPSPLTLLDELRFLRENSTQTCKIAMAGPHMFARVCFDEHYNSVQSVARDLASVINKKFKKLDQAGCDVIQLDEPIIWYLQADAEWAVPAINDCFQGIANAITAVHLCQGNFNADPAQHRGLRIFPADFSAIFPLLNQLSADAFLLAFSSLGVSNIELLKEFPKDKILGIGVVDVQTDKIETPEAVARTIESVAKHYPHDRIWVHPDCGLNHLPRDVAFAKLKAVVAGASLLAGKTMA